MQPKKYDSFQPKRATNIDGFFARPTPERPRAPVFRSAPVKPKATPAKLQDMPRRAQPQAVLSSATQKQQPEAAASLHPEAGRPRRRKLGPVPPEEGKRPKQKKKRSWKRIVKRSGLVLGSLVLLGGLWFGTKFYHDIARLTGNYNPFSLLKVFHPSPLKNQDGRVNILVAGNSADDAGHGGADLTDSIMVLSINTQNNTALMLSIPRDLWVDIPGVGHSKINAAYTNGGMDMLQNVVQKNLGLTIDYQALVNYTAFRDLVNAVGGITITIKSSDPRGIYDPNIDFTTRNCCALAKYPNGPVTLNGKQALNLARARADPSPYGYAYGFNDYGGSDFERTEHQRQMLLAIKDKASQTSVIANPFKVAALVDAVGNNVKTNLQLNEIETLYSYTKKIDDTKIDSYNINTLKGKNTTELANYTSPDGQSALIPAAGLDDFSDIALQITKLLTADPITKEGANVVVLNGTSTTGLALKQEGVLMKKGMTVSIGDYSTNVATTTIVDNSSGADPNTLAYLKKQYSAVVGTNSTLTAQYPGADFIVILGQNVVPKTTTTSQ